MIIETRAVDPFQKNGFVVSCEATRDAVFIDPGDEAPELLSYIERNRLNVRYILLTHAHVDHVAGVAAAKRALTAPVCLHRDDLFIYDRAVETGLMFGLPVERPPAVDAFYTASQSFSFGDYEITVHHTPGHCPGGVCLAAGQKGQSATDLFVGDTLFAGTIGRTDLPGGNYETLIDSIRRVLFAFGDNAIVHPGHGPDTTIGRERRTNPFLM
jgi:glyoxylase-like metal-dependent hydrolase (beta-lactamase superfamily II)